MNRNDITHINLRAPFTSRQSPVRFAHLSDLHLRGWNDSLHRLVESLNEPDLDFIVITGDSISRRNTEALDALAKLCGTIRTRRGIFAVRGNWEVLHGPPLRKLRKLFRRSGARLLTNEHQLISLPAGSICIAGLDDLCLGAPDLQMATRGARQSDFTVLLAHAPLAAQLLPPDTGVDLVLSGHTHAGQIRVPVLWRLFLPHWHGGLVEGMYDLPHVRAYVNRGFGAVGLLPMRFRCPPEIALFTIT